MIDKKTKATIFIPTYNGDQYIGDILKSIYKQKVDFNFEVLIIDSGSVDGTLGTISKYKKKHKDLRLIEIDNSEFGHGKTRNYAATIANGEIVVYLSHDAVPAHNRWLYEITKPFDINNRIVGVMGKQSPRPKCVPIQKYEIQKAFRNLGPDFGTTIFYGDDFMKNPVYGDSVSFYSDVNSAARRDFLINEIPYRDVPYAEDQLFGRDVIEAGYYKVYASRATVVHSNDLRFGEYKHRIFDEILGMRRIGIDISKPSFKHMLKMIAVGSIKDSIRTILDKEYSVKRKAFWLLVNPFYHIEKWRGYRLATKTRITNEIAVAKYSLEKIRKG